MSREEYLREALSLALGIPMSDVRAAALVKVATSLALSDPKEARRIANDELTKIIVEGYAFEVFVTLYELHRRPKDWAAARRSLPKAKEGADLLQRRLEAAHREKPAAFKRRFLFPPRSDNESYLRESKEREKRLRAGGAPAVLLFRETCLQVTRGDVGAVARALVAARGDEGMLDQLMMYQVLQHVYADRLEEAQATLKNVHHAPHRVRALCEIARLLEAQSHPPS